MSIHQGDKRSNNRTFHEVLVVVFLLGTLGLGITFSVLLEQSGKRKTKRHGWTSIIDNERHRPIPSERLLYDQRHEIQLPMGQPRAVAIGLEDKVYVAGDKAVLVLDRHGEQLFQLSVSDIATAVAVDKDGRVYVGVKDHVELFKPDGTRLTSWPSLNAEAMITSIAVGEDIFLGDFASQCVWRCDRNGKVLGRIASGEGGRRLRFCPCIAVVDVATGLEGRFWLSDHKNFQVQEYGPDGIMIRQWGRRSSSLDGFFSPCNPTHLAIGPSGRVFTSEQIIERVKVYDPDGQFLGVVVGPTDLTKGTEGLDLAVNSKGDVLVLDPKRKTIHVFGKRGPF